MLTSSKHHTVPVTYQIEPFNKRIVSFYFLIFTVLIVAVIVQGKNLKTTFILT